MLPQPAILPDEPYCNLKKTVPALFLVIFLCCSLAAAAAFPVSTTQPVNKSVAPAATTPVKFSTTTAVPVQTPVKTTVPFQTAVPAKTTTAPLPVPTTARAPLTMATVAPAFTFQTARTTLIQTAATPVACPAGWVACNGVCYCGQCGYQCPSEQGYACINGECSRPCRGIYYDEQGILHNELYCNGRCVDIFNDNSSCGSCGNACGAGESCRLNGMCMQYCRGYTGSWDWYPVENQHNHCGSCFNKCGEFEECIGRTCTCPQDPSYTLCNGVCTDLLNDENNCMLCGRKCGSYQSCVNGQCNDTCPANQLFCTDRCVDKSSLRNCGSCDHDCFRLDGQHHILNYGSCNIGQCFELCGGEQVNIDTSTEHCGHCYQSCDPGETCQKGVCTCTDPDYIMCYNKCVNLSTDKDNCGYCFYSCDEERAYCQNGRCQPPCPEWTTWCGEACVGLGIDRYNCGSCGHVCDHMCILGICI